MTFGKYRGRPLTDIPSDYLAWVVCNCERVYPGTRAAIEAELDRREARHGRGTFGRDEPPPAPGPDPRSVLTAWYRRACLRHHPDRGGNTAAMQAVNEAYFELREAFSRN